MLAPTEVEVDLQYDVRKSPENCDTVLVALVRVSRGAGRRSEVLGVFRRCARAGSLRDAAVSHVLYP